MSRLVVGIAVLVLCGGAHCNNSPEPSPDFVEDTEYCDDAELNLQKLGCLDELGFTDGTVFDAELEKDITFTTFCITRQEAGTHVFPKCLASIESCAQMEGCSR